MIKEWLDNTLLCLKMMVVYQISQKSSQKTETARFMEYLVPTKCQVFHFQGVSRPKKYLLNSSFLSNRQNFFKVVEGICEERVSLSISRSFMTRDAPLFKWEAKNDKIWGFSYASLH